MSTFPSKEWCEQAARLANEDPESAHAGKGWSADLGIVIDAEKGKLAKPFTVYCRPVDGKILGIDVLADPDDLEELGPEYLIRAPYSVWKGVLLGTVDPLEAVLRRKIAVEGDVQPILERMRYRGIAERVLAQLGTTFIDEA